MSTYHESWPSIIPGTHPAVAGKHAEKAPPSSVLGFGASKVQEKIPALPFLVPAVIEQLQSRQKYAAITVVQPGEADLYCACYVKAHGGIVLTGDSDLLVHDLGVNGSVAFLKNLNVVENMNRKSVRCSEYQIATIVERLALKPSHGIRPLAFEMVMDAHASFPNLVQRAKGCKAMTEYPSFYSDFEKEYLALPPAVHVDDVAASSENSLKTLQSLDPRISEFVLQFSRAGEAAGLPFQPPRSEDEEVQIFLPFLIDCSSKTSAWEMSTAVRQLAYGIMNLIEAEDKKISSVIEHRRQLSKESRGREWALPNVEQIEEAARGLVELYERCKDELKLDGPAAWRAIALNQDLEYAETSGKESLGKKVLAPGIVNKRLSWDVIHFSAQLQGSYYSFRMLKQILGVVVAAIKARELSGSVLELAMRLETLPSLAGVPGFYEDMMSFAQAEDRRIVAVLERWQETSDDEAAKEEAVQAKRDAAERKKNKSKRKRKDGQAEALGTPDSSKQKMSNMFALLDC